MGISVMRTPQTHLAGSVDDLEAGIETREFIQTPPGSVGRMVVDDQHIVPGIQTQDMIVVSCI